MGYQLNGTDITTLCEIAWGSGDSRTKSDFNTSKYWFNGGTRASKYPNEQFISYPSGYTYAVDGLNGKFSGFPTLKKTTYTAAARGYRPTSKYRYSTTTNSTQYINKFSDGEIWISNTNSSRTGTRISTTEQDFKYIFMCLGGAGGGGGGGGPFASAGGGGGGGYMYSLIKLSTSYVTTFTVGKLGAGGANDEDGSVGGNSSLLMRAGSRVADQLIVYGGSGGENSAGGGGVSGSTYFGSVSYTKNVFSKSGANGGSKNNSGGSAYVNFNNYTPEQEQIVYMTGSGGASGGSSGGGGGGGSPIGNGGKGGTKGSSGSNGGACAGGGGGGYKAFGSTTGGNGGSGYVAIYY